MRRNTKKSGMKSDMRYDFTSGNDTYHRDGYKSRSKETLRTLLDVLIDERGDIQW